MEMKSRQLEVNKVDEELKRRMQEVQDLQVRLQDAEKILVRRFDICTVHCMYIHGVYQASPLSQCKA